MPIVLAVALTACSTSPRYDVSTTVVAPSGKCDTARVVPVGASLPLSGRQAALGHEYLTGLELALQHVNRSGGILKDHRCLELLYKDDGGSVPTARRAVLDLTDREAVTFLVAPILADQAAGAADALTAAGVPTASLSTLDQTFRRPRYPWTFPVTASTATTTQSMVEFARAQGWHRVAIATTDDPVGREGAQRWRAAASRAGLVVTATSPVEPGRPPTSAVRALRASHPDALVIVGDSLDVAPILAARAAIGWSAPVLAGAIVSAPSVVREVGAAGVAGVFAVVPAAVVPQPGVPSTDVRSFRDELRRALHAPRIEGSVVPFAEGYDGVAMLAAAATGTRSITPANLRTYLENASYRGLLASYGYTTTAHTGVGSDQLTVAPLSHLADGLFTAPGTG